MAKLHPCCGANLKNAAKIVAIIDLIKCICIVVLFGFMMFMSGLGVIVASLEAKTKQQQGNLSNFEFTESENETDYSEIITGEYQESENNTVPWPFNTPATAGSFFTICFGFFLLMIFQLVLAVELLQGVRKRNFWRCRMWVILHSYYVVFLAVGLILSILLETHSCLWILSLGIELVIKAYSVWIAYAFIGELKNKLAITVLSRHEKM